MIIVFISLIKIDEIILINGCEYKGSTFIISSLILISQVFAGGIGTIKNNYSEIELIQSKSKISQSDSQIKIYIFIIFASHFNCVGTMARKKVLILH